MIADERLAGQAGQPEASVRLAGLTSFNFACRRVREAAEKLANMTGIDRRS